MTVQLRPYQQEAVKELEKSYQKGDRGLLALPTGAGKTFTAAWFLKDKPETVVWVAHLKELLYQAEETFKRVGRGPIGWWTADKKCIGDGVTLAQIQSCREFPPLENTILVIDEGHRVAAKSYQKLIDLLNPRWVLLVTATPYRLDSLPLGVERPTYSVSFLELVSQGYLAKPEYVRITLEVSKRLSLKTNFGGDYTKESLARIGSLKERNKIIAKYIAETDLGKTLVYLPSIESVQQVLSLLPEDKKPAAVLGSTSREERRELVSRFAAGEVQTLLNVQVFTEGFDVPDINTIVLGRPTISPTLWMQMVGRGSRLAPNKTTYRVVDFVDSVVSLSQGMLAKEILDVPLDKKDQETLERKEKKARRRETFKSMGLKIASADLLKVARVYKLPEGDCVPVMDKDMPLLKGMKRAILKAMEMQADMYTAVSSFVHSPPMKPCMPQKFWGNLCWSAYRALRGQGKIEEIWSDGRDYSSCVDFCTDTDLKLYRKAVESLSDITDFFSVKGQYVRREKINFRLFARFLLVLVEADLPYWVIKMAGKRLSYRLPELTVEVKKIRREGYSQSSCQ